MQYTATHSQLLIPAVQYIHSESSTIGEAVGATVFLHNDLIVMGSRSAQVASSQLKSMQKFEQATLLQMSDFPMLMSNFNFLIFLFDSFQQRSILECMSMHDILIIEQSLKPVFPVFQ